MTTTEFKDGTHWESGYYFAIARLCFSTVVLGISAAGLAALTTEWDPVPQIEELHDWQKFALGALFAFAGLRGIPPTLREVNLLFFSNHYVPYSAAQKAHRHRNHGMG